MGDENGLLGQGFGVSFGDGDVQDFAGSNPNAGKCQNPSEVQGP